MEALLWDGEIAPEGPRELTFSLNGIDPPDDTQTSVHYWKIPVNLSWVSAIT